MQRKPPVGLFIAGADTCVGKTYVAARIAEQLVRAGHRVGVYKPVASGCRIEAGQMVSEDAEELWHAAGRPLTLDAVCPQRFLAPLAPPRAAAEEQKRVDPALLRQGLDVWTPHCDVVIIEPAGGLMSPISDDDYSADLAVEFGYPVVLVVANRLGVINQTLQSLIVAASFRDGAPLAGVVLNHIEADPDDVSLSSNAAEIERRAGPPLLAQLPRGGRQFDREIDWLTLAGGEQA